VILSHPIGIGSRETKEERGGKKKRGEKKMVRQPHWTIFSYHGLNSSLEERRKRGREKREGKGEREIKSP